MVKKNIIIGEAKFKQDCKGRTILDKPDNRFRLLIQKKAVSGNNNVEMRSLMVYDFTGQVTCDSLKDAVKILI